MKRKTLLILAVLLTAIACLFTSCSASVEPPKEEEGLAYVTFGNGGSRSLSTEYGIKSYGELFWFYTAVKQDGFGLTGQSPKDTNGNFIPQPVKPDKNSAGQLTDINPGLDGTVGPLSQGAWVFTLYAYEQKNGTEGVNLVYQGTSATIVLKGNETRAVPVSVELKGDYGVVDLSQAYFKWAESATSGDGHVYITVTLNGKTDKNVSVNKTSLIGPLSKNTEKKYLFTSPLSFSGYEVGKIPAGYYTCTVNAYFESDLDTSNNLISSTASPKATQIFGLRVYGNATTYIKGDITENVFTDVEFTVPEQKMVAFNSSEAAVAANPAGETDSYGTPLNTTVNFGTTNLDSAATHVLTVEVTDLVTSTSKFVVTDDSARTSVAGLSFTLNSIKTVDGVTVQNEVTEFSSNDPVIVTTYVAKGLTNVGIKFNGTETADQKSPEFISYNDSTGELKFKAYHFSEYYAIANCFDALNETTNYAYTNFANAVSNAGDGNKIVLYRDVIVNSAVVVDKGLKIDLNGYSIKGNNTRALQFAIGTSEIIGSGIISSEGNAVDSSVIKVGGDTTNSVALSIGSDVIIDAKTSYGITVFGATSETLTVNGTIKSSAPENVSYDGCAVSTLGTDTTASTIIINAGAELTAINTNAIYMPSGNLTVNGGIITGTTGIYVKSGRTEVKGGTITGNGPQNDYNYYGNGGKSTGEALVVDSCGYPNGKPELSVTSGTFISKNANAVGSYNTTGNELVDRFIKGGLFSSDPRYKDLMYKSTQINNLYEVSKCNSHSVINGSCEYCEYGFFAGGNGTENDPYLIASAQQFANIYYKYNGNHFKLINDIVVGRAYSAGDWRFATPYLINGSFDGNNKTITVSDSNYDVNLFYLVQNSTIKNLNVVLDSSMVIYTYGEVLFDKVNTSGSFVVGGNEAAYVIYGFTDKLTFSECKSSTVMTGMSYNSVFVGYVNWPETECCELVFDKCENAGTLICNYASMFLGNPNAYNIKMTVTNCTNSGLIQATNTNSNLNYYYSVTSNCYGQFIINDVIYNDIADGRSSAPNCFEDTIVTKTGAVVQGPQNTGMSLSQNEDGTFTVTPATINGKTVDHYTVYVGVYAKLKAGGSSRNYVTETISASSSNLTTSLKNISFVDTQWVEEHENAVIGELAGNTIYTLDSVPYYMLVSPDTDTLDGKPKAPQMIYVNAYDANNKPLASVQLFGSIS